MHVANASRSVLTGGGAFVLGIWPAGTHTHTHRVPTMYCIPCCYCPHCLWPCGWPCRPCLLCTAFHIPVYACSCSTSRTVRVEVPAPNAPVPVESLRKLYLSGASDKAMPDFLIPLVKAGWNMFEGSVEKTTTTLTGRFATFFSADVVSSAWKQLVFSRCACDGSIGRQHQQRLRQRSSCRQRLYWDAWGSVQPCIYPPQQTTDMAGPVLLLICRRLPEQ
jgi:hypothetical protein